MITVTLHFPNADFEDIQLPAVPSKGDTFFWYEKPSESHSMWTVSSVDWSVNRYGRGPGTVGIVLDPADEAAHEVLQQYDDERLAEAHARAAQKRSGDGPTSPA
ncbi:hypothetical protein [Streptomyces sp. WAC05292]|uniref:hypothetical protein n=1 Tax=Streptomyces sp. WAC05292 TaxID=2487418 RepID=UPI000F740895|nr:hypothetical protein [Streptomyces sp. WAC05292]